MKNCSNNNIALLPEGIEVQKFLSKFPMEKIVFTDEPIPNNIEFLNISDDVFFWLEEKYNIGKVSSGKKGCPIVFNEDSSCMFKKLNIITIEFNEINTSRVTNMNEMFRDCPRLGFLDLSSFDTKNVETMERMFAECSELVYLNVESFDTSNVVSMSGMFSSCKFLRRLSLEHFDTKKVISMSWMFSWCESLESLISHNFEAPELQSVEGMFKYCKSLHTIDLTNLNAKHVRNASCMFEGCKKLARVYLKGLDIKGCPALLGMFRDANNVKEFLSYDDINEALIEREIKRGTY